MIEIRVPRRVLVNPVFQDRVTVLQTSDETGGEYSLCLLEIAPGGGNPMHTHSQFEETFIAREGVLGVNLNGRKYYLSAGDAITIPRHTPHHFFNDSHSNVSCQVKFVPGHDNFLKGLAIVYGLAADKLTNKAGIPKSLKHLAIVGTLMDTKPTGFLALLFPLLKLIAKKAHKDGTVQLLLEKYYYVSEI